MQEEGGDHRYHHRDSQHHRGVDPGKVGDEFLCAALAAFVGTDVRQHGAGLGGAIFHQPLDVVADTGHGKALEKLAQLVEDHHRCALGRLADDHGGDRHDAHQEAFVKQALAENIRRGADEYIVAGDEYRQHVQQQRDPRQGFFRDDARDEEHGGNCQPPDHHGVETVVMIVVVMLLHAAVTDTVMPVAGESFGYLVK